MMALALTESRRQARKNYAINCIIWSFGYRDDVRALVHQKMCSTIASMLKPSLSPLLLARVLAFFACGAAAVGQAGASLVDFRHRFERAVCATQALRL